MEDLENLEGIGMDREEETPKPKRKRVVTEPTPVAKAKVTTVDKVKMFYGRYNGNANAIAAQIGVAKSIVEQIIRDENL